MHAMRALSASLDLDTPSLELATLVKQPSPTPLQSLSSGGPVEQTLGAQMR